MCSFNLIVILFTLTIINVAISAPLNYDRTNNDYNGVNYDYSNWDDDIDNNHPINNDMDAEHYLSQFGYLEPEMDGKVNMSSDEGHQLVERYQRHMGLDVTGELDTVTMELMNAPRCGDPDTGEGMDHFGEEAIGNGGDEAATFEGGEGEVDGDDGSRRRRRRRRFALQGSAWPNRTIYWKVKRYSDRPNMRGRNREIDQVMKQAFDVWSRASGLKFAKARYDRPADIAIEFATGDHGDKHKFDGPGKTLAHAFFPKYGGDCHFDDSEKWSITSGYGTNMLSVAIHEFGHSLGLGHSKVKRSIMYPTYTGALGLHEDDQRAVQMLYGPPLKKSSTPPGGGPVFGLRPNKKSFDADRDLDFGPNKKKSWFRGWISSVGQWYRNLRS